MSGVKAFLGKEFREIFRTYKIYVFPVVFLAIGFMSPLLAKLTPEILGSVAKTEGVVIQLPPPEAHDAYLQLFKNLNQLLVLVVIFSLIGQVVEEKNKGSAVLMLTKPVPKWAFILSKYTAGAVLVVAAAILSYLACLYYTVIIFKDAMLVSSAQALALLIGYYLLILALTLFASTVSRSVALSGAVSVGGLFFLAVLPQLHPWLRQYSPGALSGYETKLLEGTTTFAAAVPALLGALGLAAVLVALTVLIFKQQEL